MAVEVVTEVVLPRIATAVEVEAEVLGQKKYILLRIFLARFTWWSEPEELPELLEAAEMEELVLRPQLLDHR